MARKTIRQKLRDLQRKFPNRSSYGFLYADKKDLKRKHSTIFVYALIYDAERGHSVFVWNPHRRGFDWPPSDWNKWLNKTGIAILAHDVMEAINVKRGSNWTMTRIIGFHGGRYEPKIHVVGEGKDVIYRGENRNRTARRNKANGSK